MTLAGEGKAKATIVLATGATNSEKMAARELSDYLAKVTGGKFPVAQEANAGRPPSAIYVGPTAFAAKQGVKASGLGPEDWIVRNRRR